MRRHRCDLRPVDVYHRGYLPPGVLLGRPLAQTVVLRRCASCGDLDAIVLAGEWTAEQVRGQTLSATRLPAAAEPGCGHVYETSPAEPGG